MHKSSARCDEFESGAHFTRLVDDASALQPKGKKALAIPDASSAVNRRSSRGALQHRVPKKDVINGLSFYWDSTPRKLNGYPHKRRLH
jgi:hypothetical protein